MPHRDSEIWDEIYAVEDRATRTALIFMYRIVRQMQNADQIADAVAKRVHDDRAFGWTIWQKAIAGLAGLIVVAEAIKSLAGL
jgi:hypothetical protein